MFLPKLLNRNFQALQQKVMDFDLFEPDEDDILSTLNIEPTQVPNEAVINNIPEFQCQGEDSMNAEFSVDGFIKNTFFHQNKNKAIEEVTLSSYEFQRHDLNEKTITNYVFGEACMNLQYLLATVDGSTISDLEEVSYYHRRRQITLLLHMILQTCSNEEWIFFKPHLARFRSLMNNCVQQDTWKLIYFANSNKGNECKIPAYHLLHGILEWKLLDLCILYKYDYSPGENLENTLKSKSVISQFERIMDDLVTCSIFVYSKKRSAELLFSSAFPCTCVKELWLLLQIALQKWSLKGENDDEKITFWALFNKCTERIKIKMDEFSLTPLSFCEFCNWMLNALVRLYGYRSNGHFEGAYYAKALGGENVENCEFSERITQQFLNANPNEDHLRIFITLLTPTLLQWWQPKANIPMLLWEYYHKKLNSAFYIAGTAPVNLAVTCASGRAYVDKYRKLLDKPPDANLSSYTLFVLLMGKCLESLMTSQANHQAQKLLGRIYTKFSAQKFLALNETGIHHLIELFLVLSLCGDFNDLSVKLRDKLLTIAFEKVTQPKQVAVAKGHMALWILYAEYKFDLTDYISKLMQQLTAIRNDLTVSKIIADTLLDIFDQSDSFQRGEHILIGSWLPNFLNNCTPAEQERTLEALHLIFHKIQTNEQFVDTNGELLKALNSNILPFVKQQFVNNFSNWLPILAADFCTHSFATADVNSFQKLFNYFTEQQPASRQAVAQFLLKVLETERRALVEPATILQIWLKSLVVLTAGHEEVIKLSKVVVELPEFATMTDLGAEELLQAKEPLCVFIAAIGKKYDGTADPSQRNLLANNFNSYIRNFDKWLSNDFKLEKSELIFRFYSFLAIVIYNCPHIAYAKSKITCFFHIAITRYILPTAIQMGKPPEAKLSQLIHKIWPVVVQGIGRLNFKSDAYLNKTLTDLIQKWTPHFKISSNAKQVARPFITCLQGDNHELSLFVFEKLTNLFLSTQRRQADANACLVITIYQEVVAAQTVEDVNSAQRLLTFMKGSTLATLEHIMMVDEIVPSRALLLDLFKRLIGCTIFQQSSALKDLLSEHLRILIKKHLSFYTFFLFELLMKLTTISPELVEHVVPFLMDEIRIVEAKRGAGEDNRIRSCLAKLLKSLELAKQKC